MDKIHAMQLFIRVAELESFSRAADTLGLPKGSVSRQIQALESHLGARLRQPHHPPGAVDAGRHGLLRTRQRPVK